MAEQYTPRFAGRKGRFRKGRQAAPCDPRAADVPTKGGDSTWKEDSSGEVVRSPLSRDAVAQNISVNATYILSIHI